MYILISLIGGLGLFLYGMNIMGEGLQKSTGPKLEKANESPEGEAYRTEGTRK